VEIIIQRHSKTSTSVDMAVGLVIKETGRNITPIKMRGPMFIHSNYLIFRAIQIIILM